MPLEPAQLCQLIERMWPVLVAFASRACDEPEDVVQAAFIKLAAEENAPENCSAWLFTVVRRLASNARLSANRRKHRESVAYCQYIHPKLQQPRETSEFTTRAAGATELELRELLEQLDDRERQIVIAHIWGELTFQQVADVIGESKATVWRAYQEGLAKLKKAYMETEREQR